MRVSRFILLIFFITFVALVYVYQQSEIFYLAYLGGKKQMVLSDLLDKNNIFRYNINKFSSLTYLDNSILRNVDFELPAVKQLVRMNLKEDKRNTGFALKPRPNILFSFFGRARQAQAQTLNRFPPE